jgi:hypothetical protein
LNFGGRVDLTIVDFLAILYKNKNIEHKALAGIILARRVGTVKQNRALQPYFDEVLENPLF